MHTWGMYTDLVADMVDPELTLREIVAIVLQKTVHKDTYILLQTLIQEHHEQFQSVFHKLSPKMHFMTHYPEIMNAIGPLCNVSSLRYESFHKIFKNIIKNNNCRNDIIGSCVFKIKMRCAHIFINFKTVNEVLVVIGKKNVVSPLQVLKEFHCSIPSKESFFETKFVEIDPVVYKVGIVLQDKEDKGGIPCFLIVRKVF